MISSPSGDRRERRFVFILLGLFLSAGACAPDGGRDRLRASLGEFEVSVQADPPGLHIADGRGEVLVLAAGGQSSGLAMRHAEATYDMQMGSFLIEETDADPWRPVKILGGLRREDDAVHFSLLSSQEQAMGTGELRLAEDGHLTLRLETAGASDNRLSIAFSCEAEEHFLGFGGQSFDVDHRGQTVPIWVQEDGITKADTDEPDPLWFVTGRRHSTHTPMPIFLSSAGYALALKSNRRSLFHMASDDPAVVRVEAWQDSLELHIFTGPTPADLVRELTAWTGRPALPPAFAFAPWLDAMYGSANVRRVAERLRAEHVPASVIWTEDWRGAVAASETYTLEEDWRVDRDLYPDFEALAADLHGAGFKFLTYNNSFLVSSVDVWAEAVAGGYTIMDSQGGPYIFTGATFEDTSLLDLSNPAAWAWAKEVYGAGLELGADGYMADFAEWLPTDAVLASGQSALSEHNRYPVEYQRLNREILDEMEAEDGVERLFFVRSAYLGSQPLVSVVWAGDQQTDFSIGDGMPSIIPMGIGLGLTGFPYFGHDIGGYMSSQTQPTTRELWFRWVTLGALSPVMRTHHGRSALANWNWESDEESLGHLRNWARLHIRLFPYLFGLAARAAESGAPMFRPLAYDHPDFPAGWTATDQFMLGDRIVVCPIVTEGSSQRQIRLPPGRWFPLLGGPGFSIENDSARSASADLSEIPAFVPGGTVLVLLPDTVDTLVAADPGSGLTTLAEVGDDRTLWLWPGGHSQWQEADGLGYDWQADGFDGPASSLVWNGQAVTLDGAMLLVEGNGLLEVNGQARLTVAGGDPGRRLQIRFPAQAAGGPP